jgi:hypothetical protein
MDGLARLVAVYLEPVRATVRAMQRGLREMRGELAVERVRVRAETREELERARRAAERELRDLEDLRGY